MELLLDDNILGKLTSFEMLRQNFGPNFLSHFRPIYDSTYNNASQFLLSRFSSQKSRLYHRKFWSWKLKNLCRANFLPIHILGRRKVWLRRLARELVVWKGDLGLDRIDEMDLEKGGERWPIQTEQPTLPKVQMPPRFRIQGRQNTGKPHFLVDSRSFGVVLQDRTQDKAGINLQGKTAPAHVNGPS